MVGEVGEDAAESGDAEGAVENERGGGDEEMMRREDEEDVGGDEDEEIGRDDDEEEEEIGIDADRQTGVGDILLYD